MNKVNFDSLSAYKAPEEWIAKAAVIPETSERKRTAVPVFRAAAAAGIVLVSAVGILVFLLIGDGKAPIATRSGGVVTESAADGAVGGKTEESGSPAPAETVAVLSTDADGNTVITYREKLSPTLNDPQPTGGRIDPSVPIPTDVPAVPSTEHHPVPTEGSVPPTDSPAESPLTDCRFYVTVKYPASEEPEVAADEVDEPIVFCLMYDADGDLVGSSSLFAEEKRATVVSVDPDGSFVVTYDPLEKGLPITRGRYTYVLVDYHIGTELCRGSILY